MWRLAIRWIILNISKALCFWTSWPFNIKHYVPSKCWEPFTQWPKYQSQTRTCNHITVKTSQVTNCYKVNLLCNTSNTSKNIICKVWSTSSVNIHHRLGIKPMASHSKYRGYMLTDKWPLTYWHIWHSNQLWTTAHFGQNILNGL